MGLLFRVRFSRREACHAEPRWHCNSGSHSGSDVCANPLPWTGLLWRNTTSSPWGRHVGVGENTLSRLSRLHFKNMKTPWNCFHDSFWNRKHPPHPITKVIFFPVSEQRGTWPGYTPLQVGRSWKSRQLTILSGVASDWSQSEFCQNVPKVILSLPDTLWCLLSPFTISV